MDEQIGIRVIPFVVRFGDKAFNRIEDDKDWVDRYFNPDGTPRTDPLEWVQYVPGGAALHVARNWAKGYPCEWSELGWAAIDVADIGLAIASFGGSKVATGAVEAAAKRGGRAIARAEVKAIGKAARAAAEAAPEGARVERVSLWRRALAEFRAALGRSRTRMSRAAEMARSVKAGTEVLGKTLWGGVKLVAKPVRVSRRVARRALDAWKRLSRAKKVWVYRALLAVGLYVTTTERTLPNFEKISNGVGDLVGKAAAGAVTMAGDALASALKEFAEQMTGGAPWARHLVYWAVAGTLMLLMLWSLFRAIRSRRRAVVVRA